MTYTFFFGVAFAYFKVFQVIRHQEKHKQMKVTSNKYKQMKQILHILLISVLCYCPLLCFQLTINLLQDMFIKCISWWRSFSVLVVIFQ